MNCEWKTHRLKFPLTLAPVADGHFKSNESVSGAGFVKLVLFICMDKNKENSFKHGSVDLWLWWWCVLNITRAPFATDCSRANPYICYWQHIDICFTWNIVKNDQMYRLLYPRPTKLELGYTGFTLSVRPSVRLSVDDMVSGVEVCFVISISNFISMLMVVIGKSLLIFSDISLKMAA